MYRSDLCRVCLELASKEHGRDCSKEGAKNILMWSKTIDNDQIGGLYCLKSGVDDRKISEQEQLSYSQSEFEQEQEFCDHAEMHGGGGDAKRASQKRAKIVCERTDDTGKRTQTVLRGEDLSYRTKGHTPGGTNETMIEYCAF